MLRFENWLLAAKFAVSAISHHIMPKAAVGVCSILIYLDRAGPYKFDGDCAPTELGRRIDCGISLDRRFAVEFADILADNSPFTI